MGERPKGPLGQGCENPKFTASTPGLGFLLFLNYIQALGPDVNSKRSLRPSIQRRHDIYFIYVRESSQQSKNHPGLGDQDGLFNNLETPPFGPKLFNAPTEHKLFVFPQRST